MKSSPLRISKAARAGAKWLVVALVVGFAVYRMKFAPMPVVTHTLATGPVVAEVMGTGTLEARVKTTISPRIQERLAEVLVDQGDAVKAGQLLARLDDGELKMQVEVAEAARAAASATPGAGEDRRGAGGGGGPAGAAGLQADLGLADEPNRLRRRTLTRRWST